MSRMIDDKFQGVWSYYSYLLQLALYKNNRKNMKCTLLYFCIMIGNCKRSIHNSAASEGSYPDRRWYSIISSLSLSAVMLSLGGEVRSGWCSSMADDLNSNFITRLKCEFGSFGWYLNGFSHQFSPTKINSAMIHCNRNNIYCLASYIIANKNTISYIYV